MEHYKATLATTACALAGLVAAAHILHPGNYEVQARPVRAPMTAVAPAAAAWVDPPADLRSASATPKRVADVPASSASSDLLTPRMVAVLPPGAIMAPALPATIAAAPGRKVASAATRRRKLAQRTPRTREASLDRQAPETQPVALRADTPEPKAKIDPIGALIRGLGFGGEG